MLSLWDVESAKNGDAFARSQLIASLQTPILTLAMRMLSDRSLAEDATQEALIKILSSLDQFRGESKFSTWAYSVAARAIIDFRRGAFRNAVVSFDAFSADLQEGLEPEAVERSEDAVYLGQILVGCARALLLCVDAEHRLAYIVGQVMELGAPEGAVICGVSPEAFRKRLSRARQSIELALNNNCGVIRAENDCRCHRRLQKARELGRVDSEGQLASIDVRRLQSVVNELHSLSQKVAQYSVADPGEVVSPELASRLRTLAQGSSG